VLGAEDGRRARVGVAGRALAGVMGVAGGCSRLYAVCWVLGTCMQTAFVGRSTWPLAVIAAHHQTPTPASAHLVAIREILAHACCIALTSLQAAARASPTAAKC